ncbi:4Fe-4S Wbl-type domain-containing protein [Candidatus Magnetomoraceae bacterium gMMP-1]
MAQPNQNTKYPACFGDLEKVFPLGQDGLRTTPDFCMTCVHKTECLRFAMTESQKGLKAKEEYVDRAYDSGLIGFWARWSRKKQLHSRIKGS